MPPLEVVLRSWGEPTLLSVYLQFAARLLCVSGAGVREGAKMVKWINKVEVREAS